MGNLYLPQRKLCIVFVFGVCSSEAMAVNFQTSTLCLTLPISCQICLGKVTAEHRFELAPQNPLFDSPGSTEPNQVLR